MYSRYNEDKTCLSSKTPTCLIFKALTFILYDLINHPSIMGARHSCGKSQQGVFKMTKVLSVSVRAKVLGNKEGCCKVWFVISHQHKKLRL
jgi:hypothetical protein